MILATVYNAEILKNRSLQEEKSREEKSLNAVAKKRDAVVNTATVLLVEVSVANNVLV